MAGSQRGRAGAAADAGRRRFLKGSIGLAAGAALAGPARCVWGAASPLIVDVGSIPVPDFSASNRHPGVELALVGLACSGLPLYQTQTPHPLGSPSGMIAADDVVLIKVNGQWQYRGVTNSDVVRGVIQRVLEHPDGFAGEVVVVENGQGQGSLDCDRSWPGTYPDNEVHANAEDETHSFRYLIEELFAEPRVSGYLLDPIRRTWIGASEHVDDGYRQLGGVSYPCFTTAGGRRVELAEGVWDGAAHHQRLKLINIPVFKHHNGSAITGALKHSYGLLSMDGAPASYHYSGIGNATGDMFSLVRAPVLNLIDCIWVSPGALSGWPESNTVRTDRLLAGLDPVALDYYAGKQILFPAGGNPYHDPDRSADFQAFLSQARDRINLNGGLFGEQVSYDEALFRVVRLDVEGSPEPLLVHARKRAADVELSWSGGSPPFRIRRASRSDLSDAVELEACCLERRYLDPGAAADGLSHYYEVQ